MAKQSKPIYDWLIIGGGVSGCYFAHKLVSDGAKVCLLEKARGLGGRLCARRTPFGTFLHGAQFFTIRDERFQVAMSPFLENGILTPWSVAYIDNVNRLHPPDSTVRYSIYPDTSTICKSWTTGADVFLRHKVVRVSKDTIWQIEVENNATFQAKNLVIGAPLPQAVDLLSGVLDEQVDLSSKWQTAATVMVSFTDNFEPLPSDIGGCFVSPTTIDFIASQESRTGLQERKNWVFVLSHDWAVTHWKAATETAIYELRKSLAQLNCPSLPEIVHQDIQFWKYASPVASRVPIKQYYPQNNLGLVGEFFCGGRVEGGFLSAVNLYDEVFV